MPLLLSISLSFIQSMKYLEFNIFKFNFNLKINMRILFQNKIMENSIYAPIRRTPNDFYLSVMAFTISDHC